MNLENRIRSHYESTTRPTEPVDIEGVKMRGNRLRRRARFVTALLSVAAFAAVGVVAVALSRSDSAEPDTATLLSEKPLYDQIVESWTPVPDPVDVLLATRVQEICPFDERTLSLAARGDRTVGLPSIRVIDQRGISAHIAYGVETTTGHVGGACSALMIDGVWQNDDGLLEDQPDFRYGAGGPIPDYVGEIRLRFPDGTEVTASLANGWYIVTYPGSFEETLTEPNDYVYMDYYTEDGALIKTEFYLSLKDVQQANQLEP